MGRLSNVIGTEIVDDIRLGHTWHEYHILEAFILERMPKWFVEVGVHEGGLAYMLLRNSLLNEVSYLGIELDCNLVRPQVKGIINKRLHSDLLCVDCFGSTAYSLVSNLTDKMIYCDGGNKAKELVHFKQFCDPGDVILAHDFYDGTRIVRDVPVENISIEVVADDIIHMEEDETFERLDEEIFKETRIIGWMKV
jgi:hypothetical protein